MNKILVTGGSGQVGQYLRQIIPDAIYISSEDYDLTIEKNVEKLFSKYQPNTVIHLAAKVGGIMDNIQKPAEYFTLNVLMNTLILKYAHKNNVKRFLGVLSTCVYPDSVDQYPIKEDILFEGPPTTTNFAYGYSKRMLAVQIDSYNKQYNTNYNYIMPSNLYSSLGKFDNTSHFVNALLKKINYAVKNNKKYITLFGDGTPLRQFMHAKDLAAIIALIIKKDITDSFNIAPPDNLSIDEIAKIALKVTNNLHLEIKYDETKPNGQFRKDVSTELFRKYLEFYKFINIEEGILEVYNEKFNHE